VRPGSREPSRTVSAIRHRSWRSSSEAPVVFSLQKRLPLVDFGVTALASEGDTPEEIMIDSPHLKAQCTAASLLKKGMLPTASGAPRAG
jgi:hypothetical protein